MRSGPRSEGVHRAPAFAGGPAAVLATEQVTIHAGTLRAVWLLLAVLTVVLLWALYELRRRRRLALRLDRLSNVSGTPRNPASSGGSPRDYEAMLEIIALDERLPAIAQRVEALGSAHEVTDSSSEPQDAASSGDTV